MSTHQQSQQRTHEPNKFYRHFAERRYEAEGQQHAPRTDSNQRERLAEFEAQQLRLRYGFDVAF
jgi:hypothetical protein